MKKHKTQNFEWHFPDTETHFIEMLGINPEYQFKNKSMILKFRNVIDFSCVLDIGANVGLWTRWFNAIGAKTIHCFEPIIENVECLRINTADLNNVIINDFALLDKAGEINIYTTLSNDNTGTATIFANDAFVVPHKAKARTLDELDLAPTFIKIDVQGAELLVLQGAEQTIQKYKPAMIVECEDDKMEPLEFLKSFGYKIVKHTTNDFLLLADNY